MDGAAPGGAAAALRGGAGAGASPSAYLNLSAYSSAHQGADASLEALYGDRALWVRAHQGQYGRGEAAAAWRAMGH